MDNNLNPYVYKDNTEMYNEWISKLNGKFKEAEAYLNNQNWVYFNTFDQTDLDDWQYNLAFKFASLHDNSIVFIYFSEKSLMNRFNEFYHIESSIFQNGSKIILSDGKRMVGIDKNEVKPNGFHNENMLFIVNKIHWFHKWTIMTSIRNTATGRNNIILGIDDISKEEQEIYLNHPRFKIIDVNG